MPVEIETHVMSHEYTLLFSNEVHVIAWCKLCGCVRLQLLDTTSQPVWKRRVLDEATTWRLPSLIGPYREYCEPKCGVSGAEQQKGVLSAQTQIQDKEVSR